ncbi:MAG: tetratricopeptide repeat protein, partial [Methanomassiliicoccales archaeon]
MEKILSGSKKEKYIHDKSRKLLEKGKQYQAKSNDTKASAQYTKLIDYLESHKDDITSYKGYISGVYNDLGEALIEVKRQRDALKIFDKAISLDPKNTGAWI